ncbi:MAG TPA: MobF family relaxase [Bryobacteraceae bacterium]|nr:MobF family relaxase [Bryobacteraceae bacterium]
MLTPKAQLNLQHAREYFREHLSVGDYYAQGKKVAGEWFGEGAEKLGLKGSVKESDFLALCDGLNPTTKEKLTARKNSQRRENGRTVANRRVFYDFTISPPKSVSVVALLQDDRISELHDRAVKQAMVELEKFAAARVRKSGQHSDRATGNIVAAAFRHDTSRELDPHLHTHCVVLNATFDPVEQRWKALEVHGMYRAQKFAENFYYHELAKGLRSLGYVLESNARDFEIKGVPRSVITRFSKRHRQIDDEAKRRLEREGMRVDANTLRRQVAHDDRKRKMKDSTADRLRPTWMKQLVPDEAKALTALKPKATETATRTDATAALAWADEHLFERRSVVSEPELWAEALARGRGENFGLRELRAAIDQRGYVRERGTNRLTSREVLGWELECVVAAHDGRNEYGKLAPDYRASEALSSEQKAAVEKILASRHLIMLFSGGAGTGKSRTLQEVERGLTAANRPVVVLAPQRQQVRDLEADGLAAETLARFLVAKQLPHGAVVVLDEAGQVGGRDLGQLIRVVRANAGRLILSGDTRQHGAVAASDALRAIEKHSGVKPIRLQQIRRQDPKLGTTASERQFIRRYRAAVKAAAKGNIAESFDRLDRLGCIRECGSNERRSALATEYVSAVSRKEKALVVAQTRDETCAVNEAIREQLQATGHIGVGQKLATFRPLDLGEAQKRDPRFYEAGQYACFLQRYGRYAKGELCEIAGANEHGIMLVKDGRRSTLSYRYASRLVVAARNEMELAPGDRLQLKVNGESVEGKRFANGELVTVRHVKKNGALVVSDDSGETKTLAPSQRVFVRGYAVTSYGSQGKTVDTVLFADAASRAATNANQWYVSITRGRKRVLVFTADKAELRETIVRAGDRELAIDLKPATSGMSLNWPEWHRRAQDAAERYRRHHAVVTHGKAQHQNQRIAV